MQFPVFPLNGAILFPGTNLPLNIFEPRYIQMVDYALSNNRFIGMILSREDGAFFNIGCLGKITNFTDTIDGTYQINLQGLNRFRYNKTISTVNKFITIEADELIYKETKKEKNISIGKNLLLIFKKFLNVKKITFNTSDFEKLNAINLAKIICVISPLNYLIKQMLLEFDSEEELCTKLISVLEIEINNIDYSLKIN